MPTKLIIHGRTYRSGRHEKPENQMVLNKDRQGDPLRSDLPIQSQPVDTKLRAGVVFECPADKITYRVILRCDPLERWASSGFWQRRLQLRHKDLLKLVEYGWFDAAIEEGSAARYFRCRDERKMKESWEWKKLRAAIKSAETQQAKAEKLRGKVGYRGFRFSPATTK